MKTFTFFFTFYLVTLITTIQAQGELSVLMGIHPYGKIYDMTSGSHTAIQYNMADVSYIKYGLIAQHSRFTTDQVTSFAPQVTSLNGFASVAFIKNRLMKSYIKMEIGAAYASSSPSLESRGVNTTTSPSHFMSAEVNPAIGTEIMLSKAFILQLEYKNVLHYGQAQVIGGAYNYAGLDMGITYKFSKTNYIKRPYGIKRTHCKYSKKIKRVKQNAPGIIL